MLSAAYIFFIFVSIFILELIGISPLSAQVPTKDSVNLVFNTVISDIDSSFQRNELFSNLLKLHFLKKTADTSVGLTVLNKIFNRSPSSEISFGYDYGLVPGYDYNKTFPVSALVSEGNISLKVARLPFEVAYHYCNDVSSFGVGNYIHISFDYQAYKNEMESKREVYIKKLSGQLDSLKLSKQTALQKAYYWQMMASAVYPQLSNPKSDSIITPFKNLMVTEAEDTVEFLKKGAGNRIEFDSLNVLIGAKKDFMIPDSSSISSFEENADTVLEKQSGGHTLQRNVDHSVEKAVSSAKKFMNLYEDYSRKIGETQVLIDQAKTVAGNPMGFITTLNPLEKLMMNTRKFDLGLSYPSSSIFLINDVPLRGADFEWNVDSYYFTASAGMVENNSIFPVNLRQDLVGSTQGFINLFHFKNIDTERKVLSFKGGRGKKEGSHIFLGLLSGWGAGDKNFIDSLYESTIDVSKEQNLVLELDGKLEINNHHSINISVAKSAIDGGEVGESKSQGLFQQLINPEYHSKALSGNYHGEFEKIDACILVSGSYTDPLFTSFGMGFFHRNYLKYEFRIEKRLFSSWKASAYYRRRHDNLVEIFDYNNILQSGGLTVSGRIGRSWSVMGSYEPIFHQSSIKGDSLSDNTRNDISNLCLVYNKHIGYTFLVVNTLYTSYRLTDLTGKNYHFSNAEMICSLDKKSMSHELSVNFISPVATDSLAKSMALFEYQLSFSADNKLSFITGINYSLNKRGNSKWGFLVSAKYGITKYMNLFADLRRLVIDEYYNSFENTRIEKFPYQFSTRLTINLNRQ